MLYNIILYHIILYHIILYHIILYQIIYIYISYQIYHDIYSYILLYISYIISIRIRSRSKRTYWGKRFSFRFFVHFPSAQWTQAAFSKPLKPMLWHRRYYGTWPKGHAISTVALAAPGVLWIAMTRREMMTKLKMLKVFQHLFFALSCDRLTASNCKRSTHYHPKDCNFWGQKWFTTKEDWQKPTLQLNTLCFESYKSTRSICATVEWPVDMENISFSIQKYVVSYVCVYIYIWYLNIYFMYLTVAIILSFNPSLAWKIHASIFRRVLKWCHVNFCPASSSP